VNDLLKRYPIILFLAGVLATVAISPLWQSEPAGMQISFRNDSQQMIQSIKLDFGNADGQSSILTLRLAPGETRPVVLNHQPGLGFNVKVTYANGQQQSFCALKGDEARNRLLPLAI